jgi:hypothetical protein
MMMANSGGGSGLGGAVFNRNGTLTFTNVTFVGNQADQGGADVYNLGDGSGSTAGATLTNDILSAPVHGVTAYQDNTNNGGSATSTGGNNLIAQPGNFGGTSSAANPLLAALGNYGGPTQTFALLPGSPAIDAGTGSGAPATDQRGISRPQGAAVDIGAFESRGFTLGITGGDNQQGLTGTTFASPLSVQVTSAFGEPVQGGQVTFSAPASGASATFPDGTLTLDANGKASLSATANSTGGGYTVTATTTGAAAVNFSLTNVAPLSLPAALPGGTYGSAYSQTLTPTGGVGGPYTFTVTVGSPPPGLTFASNGLLAGRPTALGSFTFTVQVADAGKFTASQSYTVTISPATLSATGVNVQATAGAPFNGTVATFTSPDQIDSAAAFTALITWGDGSTSKGVISGSNGSFTVCGSHTYAAAANEAICVQISHKLGYTTTATTHSTATVTSLGQGVGQGLTASISFWSSSSGQALIEDFNSGEDSRTLSAWLATAFPNLYGADAGGGNLTGKTNAQVAAFSQMLFALGGTEAQVLATALSVYATTSSLGGTAGRNYGFNVSAAGLGARSYRVGADGAAVGVSNNTTLNVYQLLQGVNAQAHHGVLYGGNEMLGQEAGALFGALNQEGSVG